MLRLVHTIHIMYKLASSYIITSLIRWIAAFLIPLVIQEITDSAFFTSLSFAISIAPSVLVLPFAGVIGDHLNKKRIIQICELCNIVVLVLLITIPFQKKYIYLIFLFDFLLNALAAIHHPIFQAMVPLTVPKERMNRFNAYLGASGHLIAILGPIIVSLLLRVMDKKSSLYLLIGAYLCSFLLVSWIDYHEKKSKKSIGIRTMLTSFYEGFQYVKNHPFFRYSTPFFFFVNFGMACVRSNLIHYFKHYRHIQESELSQYFLVIGLGSMLGALLAPHIMKRYQREGALIVYFCFLATLAMIPMAFVDNIWFITLSWALSQGCCAVVIVAFFTLRQKTVSMEFMSRTVAFTRAVTFLAMPFSAVISGWVFQRTGNFSLLIGIGSTVMLLGMLFFYRPLLGAVARMKRD